MKLAHILVCHTTDPTKAVESIPHQEGAVWYVFLHSRDAEIERKVEALMALRDGNVFTYRENRGLARSWNDGLHLAMEAGCDAALLLNDDLFFYDGGYAAFIHTIAVLKGVSRNISYVTPLGLETGTSAHAGQVLPQQFACCAIMPETVELVGYFDETFTPAYYEDIDYDRRTRLAGMTVHVHQAVIVEHERSSTHRNMTVEAKRDADAAFNSNRTYFNRKWGGDNPSYSAPFNNSELSLNIAYANRRKPYGQLYVEKNIGSATDPDSCKPSPSSAISRDEVIWLYRCLFGREVENEHAIEIGQASFSSFAEARATYMGSQEFSVVCNRGMGPTNAPAEPGHLENNPI